MPTIIKTKQNQPQNKTLQKHTHFITGHVWSHWVKLFFMNTFGKLALSSSTALLSIWEQKDTSSKDRWQKSRTAWLWSSTPKQDGTLPSPPALLSLPPLVSQTKAEIKSKRVFLLLCLGHGVEGEINPVFSEALTHMRKQRANCFQANSQRLVQPERWDERLGLHYQCA